MRDRGLIILVKPSSVSGAAEELRYSAAEAFTIPEITALISVTALE